MTNQNTITDIEDEEVDLEADFFETLAKRYPALFRKSTITYLGVGPGWYNIIDTLCSCIYNRYQRADNDVGYIQNKEVVDQGKLTEAVARRDTAENDLPVIMQVKEKFGTLRFYTNGGTDEDDHYIRFAEHMSAVTCETCGSPGETRNSGWIKVLCDEHHKENEAKRKY